MDFFMYGINCFTDFIEIQYGRPPPKDVRQLQFTVLLSHSKT